MVHLTVIEFGLNDADMQATFKALTAQRSLRLGHAATRLRAEHAAAGSAVRL
jgi:hypothetical protein